MSNHRLRYIAELPRLREPVLIMSLEGFIDAGDAGQSAAMFLRHRWRAKQVAQFDRDTFLDYRARRPTTVIDGGVIRRIDVDDIELWAAQLPDAEHDVVFLLGPEPDMAWESFAETVVTACRQLNVQYAISLGAYPAAVPHTRPTRIMSAINDAVSELPAVGVPVSGYTGPIGAQVLLQHDMGKKRMPAIGLWVEVPHYIAANPHPASVLSLVTAVAGLLEVDVDTEELQAAASLNQNQIDEAIGEHPEAAEMIERLETNYDDPEERLSIPSGDALAAEIERFLSEHPE